MYWVLERAPSSQNKTLLKTCVGLSKKHNTINAENNKGFHAQCYPNMNTTESFLENTKVDG